MWEKVGIIRSKTGLTQALEELESLQDSFDHRRSPKEIMSGYFEVRSMLITAMAVTRAALFREESRGAHFREDFPEPRLEMAKSLLINLDQGEMKLSLNQ